MYDDSPETLKISRERAAALGHETVAILAARSYVTNTGVSVDIGDAVARAKAGTVTYGPADELPQASHHAASAGATAVEVHNITTLAGAKRLQGQGCDPAALNFASATHPGGGFLTGARAQEEYLARSSGLYACLAGNPMYAYHAERRDPFYSHFVIYSPAVPVIRDDRGELLETPGACAILTSPAVHAAGVRKYMPGRLAEIGPVMWERILKVLAAAERHGHRSLVLGAWGCGVFGNDGEQIAGLFRRALAENFRGAFDQVLFAITDWSEEQRYIGPFRRAFGGG